MELHRFSPEIDHLRALIVVEERDAEAEEEIFQERELNIAAMHRGSTQLKANQLHRKLLPTSSCHKFLTSTIAAQVRSSLGFFNIRANRESREGRDGAGGKWIQMVFHEFLL